MKQYFIRHLSRAFRVLKNIDRTILLAFTVGVGALITLLFWFLSGSTTIHVANEVAPEGTRAPITGLACDNPEARPVAIMLASDPEARPLSGVSEAELVIEMPVTPNGITRMMAVYQCTNPEEVGSIRSARMDFLGLVQGMDAIYAHWGGEQEALERLNNGLLDNIDALAYEGTVFYRKPETPPPHNGFTSLERVREQAESLSYDATWNGSFWAHRTEKPRRSLGSAIAGVTLSYPTGSRIRWTYDNKSNEWLRTRDDSPEIDALTNETVRAGAVILMETESSFVREQYISVRMTGEGTGTLYQDGMRQNIRWSKPNESDMLRFFTTDGSPVALAPGAVWISVITPSIDVQ